MAAKFEKLMSGADGALALLQVMAENSFDSVLITGASAEGKIVYANKSFKKLTGYDPSEVIVKTPRTIGLGHRRPRTPWSEKRGRSFLQSSGSEWSPVFW